VLALNSLRVHSASVNIHEGSAISEFVVSPHFGSPPAAGLLRQELIGALDGEVDIMAKLEQRNSTEDPKPVGEAPTAVPVHRSTAPPRILWLEGGAPDRQIIEIRASDRTGLLALLTGALERAGADIDWAKVTTLGSMVDDVFCVSLPDHADARTVVEQHLLAVLGTPAPAG